MPRVLALVAEPIRGGVPGKASRGLLGALPGEVDVTAIVRPTLGTFSTLTAAIATFRPAPRRWKRRFDLNPVTFRGLSRAADRELARRAGGFDVVLQFQTLFASGPAPAALAICTDNIYALTAEYYPSWAPLSARESVVFARLEQEAFERAAVVFVKSDFLRRGLVDNYGIDTECIVTVGGGANSYRPTLLPDGSRYEAQRALFVGYDFVRKGGEVLLAAWPHVRAELPRAELWIAGPEQGSDLPGVRWFGRLSDRAAVARLYDEASAFVMPSLFEPYGYVFFEAQGHGLACIGANHCAMPELIAAGETGLLVPPRDEIALAESLVALLGNPLLAEEYGRRAHERILASGLWKHVAARVARQLELLV